MLTLACSRNSKSHICLTLFMNFLPLLPRLTSIFTSFIFISAVHSTIFSACILASPLGSKRSFSNLLELSTNFYAILLFRRKSMSHSCLILFIKFLPFCLSFLFICTNFNFFLFVHASLSMIRTMLSLL